MDHTDDPFESSSSTTIDENIQPSYLIEESWFFGNLLDTKPKSKKFLRCFSDPCPSSNYNQEMMMPSITYSPKKSPKDKLKLSKGNGFASSKLAKTPSLPPPCMPRKEVLIQENERGFTTKKCSLHSPLHSLIRAPSVPPCIGREGEFEDAESDFALSKLIRQASLETSEVLPPRQPSSKVTNKSRPKFWEKRVVIAPIQSPMCEGEIVVIVPHRLWKELTALTPVSNTINQHPRSRLDLDSINTDGLKEMRRRYTSHELKMRKGVDDLESEQVRSFKDMGFTFDKEEMNCAPPVPNLVEKRSPKDMKMQIKFWARAVASNVRQEC